MNSLIEHPETLTLQQERSRRSLRNKVSVQVPQTDEELWDWLRFVTGFQFARHASCPDHDSPFSWMADLYFGRVNRMAVLAPRGGGKTQGSACLHWVTGASKESYRIAHFGGTMQQANQCQGYITEIANRPGVEAVLREEPRATWVRWAKGAHLTIHTATEKQASGGHPQRKQADEFDLWKYEVWQKFLGMGTTTADPGAEELQTIYTSTRSRKYGLMHNLISSADKRGIRVYQFCIWDVKAKCAECLQSACELWEWCQGLHQKSDGHIPRSVVVDKVMQMDEDTVRSELWCQEPSTRGLVWPNFDSAVRAGSNVDPAAEFNPDWDVFWGCDDNYEQPRCVALCQLDPTTGFLHIFDEYYRSHQLASETIHTLLTDKERYPYPKPKYAIPDAQAKELHGSLHREGIATFAPKNYRRAEGPKVAHRWIRDARGRRMVLIHPRCENIIRSIGKHHLKDLPASATGEPQFTEDPEKHDDDHGAEVLSYILWVRRGMG